MHEAPGQELQVSWDRLLHLEAAGHAEGAGLPAGSAQLVALAKLPVLA